MKLNKFKYLIITILVVILGTNVSANNIVSNEYYTLEDLELCSTSEDKSYMSYKTITDKRSRQYKLLQELNITETGLIKDDYGFIAAALGSYYGAIGDRFVFTLDSGVQLYLIKADAKSDSHTHGGCSHTVDHSVIEFVIDEAKAKQYFGVSSNNLVKHGNFNNIDMFKGNIIDSKKVTINKEIIPDEVLSPFITE